MRPLRALPLLAAALAAACSVEVGSPLLEPPPEAPAFEPIASAGQFLDLVAGKPMTFENGGVLIANPDGTLGGEFAGETPGGSWTFSAGQFCRAVRLGAQDLPEVCNIVEAGENAVRFLNLDGTLSSEAELG